MTVYDIDKMVGGGSRESLDGCLIDECEHTFQLIGEPHQFMLVNWDRNKVMKMRFQNYQKLLEKATLI